MDYSAESRFKAQPYGVLPPGVASHRDGSECSVIVRPFALSPPEELFACLLTLPAINGQGFFLHPARLPLALMEQAVEAVCPEAFTLN